MSWLNVKESTSPFIFSIPHSGTLLSSEAERNLLSGYELELPNIDWHLNELYDFLFTLDVNVISTSISRYVVDLNRSTDSELFGDYKCSLIYKRNTKNGDIYRTFPNKNELKKRIEDYYIPYHLELDRLVEKATRDSGVCYLFDLHSFMGPIECDICLGNRDGASCSNYFIKKVNGALTNKKFYVEQNAFYKGGYITSKYIHNAKVESLQVELRYTNYLDAKDYECVRSPSINEEKFINAKNRLKMAFTDIVYSHTIF